MRAPAPDPRSFTPNHLAEKILTSRSALEGERKQVNLLFADVKGSLELAEQVDPEEWHQILDRFFQLLADGVHRFEGTVNQYTGDGIMALFGAPIAHEDHAQRACWAALHLRDQLRRYAEELRRTRGLGFSVRLGLNSGEVVVGRIGDDLRMDYTAQGHTVGLAARMAQLAAPDQVYLSDHTAALVAGFFRLRDLGLFGVHLLGYNLNVGSAWRRGLILVLIGRLAEAARTLEGGGELARECGDVEGLAAIHVTNAILGYQAGDANRTQVHARKAMEIAEKIGSPLVRLLALWMLGRADLLSGNWHDAVAAVERALAGAREKRTGLNQEPLMLADVAAARLASGETAAARAAAEEALDVARRRGMRVLEIQAHIVLGRVLIQAGGRREEVEAGLDAALGLVEETGARVNLPFIHLERAALARSLGDGASRERELREAHRLFTEMGAPIRAEQVARELECFSPT